jgi:hypothetical protein
LEVADLDRWETGHLDEAQVAALEGLGFQRTEMNFQQRVWIAGEEDADRLEGSPRQRTRPERPPSSSTSYWTTSSENVDAQSSERVGTPQSR